MKKNINKLKRISAKDSDYIDNSSSDIVVLSDVSKEDLINIEQEIIEDTDNGNIFPDDNTMIWTLDKVSNLLHLDSKLFRKNICSALKKIEKSPKLKTANESLSMLRTGFKQDNGLIMLLAASSLYNIRFNFKSNVELCSIFNMINKKCTLININLSIKTIGDYKGKQRPTRESWKKLNADLKIINCASYAGMDLKYQSDSSE